MMWLVGSESFSGSVFISRSHSRNTKRKFGGSRTLCDSSSCASRVHSQSETWKSFKPLDSIFFLFFFEEVLHTGTVMVRERVYSGKLDWREVACAVALKCSQWW